MSRYIQQISVPEIGINGQHLFSQARVLIIGAGGLGIPTATYLASSGIGNIGIADGDTIALTNLHRQFLYSVDEVEIYKAEILSKKLKIINPEINIESFPFMTNDKNIEGLIQNFDIVCDCTDNVDARLLIDKYCFQFQKPLVYAAVTDWQGYLTILNHKNKIRLTDIFSEEKLRESSTNNCNTSGIVSSACGILGSMQATEVFKIILNLNTPLDGYILCINSLVNTYKTFKINTVQKQDIG